MLFDFSLENFSWVCKSARDSPNAYAESLVEYMRTTFQCLGPMDDGSRAGLHFSCCGYVAERLVKLFTDPVEDADGRTKSSGGIPPVDKIDPFGLKNLATDIRHFEVNTKSTLKLRRQMEQTFFSYLARRLLTALEWGSSGNALTRSSRLRPPCLIEIFRCFCYPRTATREEGNTPFYRSRRSIVSLRNMLARALARS